MNSDISTRLVIGDVGSTKGAWTGLMADGTSIDLLTDGYNPHAHPEEVLHAVLERLTSRFGHIDRLIYYGTGISDDVVAREVETLIGQVVDADEVRVESDLVGAARASLQDAPGIVAILGTGSNACRYDGARVSMVTPSLGYPLGDEGSGWRIGSLMIKGYYYGEMPGELRIKFRELLPDSRREMLTYIKGSTQPNRYLASFATFAGDNQKHPWISETVSDCLDVFVRSHLLPLTPAEPVFFVGSIARSFNEILDRLLTKHGLQLGGILADPLEALIKYHTDS